MSPIKEGLMVGFGLLGVVSAVILYRKNSRNRAMAVFQQCGHEMQTFNAEKTKINMLKYRACEKSVFDMGLIYPRRLSPIKLEQQPELQQDISQCLVDQQMSVSSRNSFISPRPYAITRPVQEEQAYNQAFDSLKKSLEEQEMQESNNRNFQQQQEERYLEEQRRKKEMIKQNAEFIKSQIEAKKGRQVEESHKRSEPAINPAFHGYPSIPETPKEVRRKRELQAKRQFQEDLKSQATLDDLRRSNEKSQERQMDLQHIAMDNSNYENQLKNAAEKKQQMRQVLRNSWDQHKQTKVLRNAIDEYQVKGTYNTRTIQMVEHERSRSNSPHSNSIEAGKGNRSDDIELNGDSEMTPIYHGTPTNDRYSKNQHYIQNGSNTNVITTKQLGRTEKIRARAQQIKQEIDAKEIALYNQRIKQVINKASKARNSQSLPRVKDTIHKSRSNINLRNNNGSIDFFETPRHAKRLNQDIIRSKAKRQSTEGSTYKSHFNNPFKR